MIGLKKKKDTWPFLGPNRSFRKRDKIAFMGRKVYKNAKAVGSFIRGGKGQKRKMAGKLIRKVFHQDSPTGSVRGEDLTLGRSELPEAYLEVDYEDNEGDECWAEALTAMTRSLRIFGLFDQSLLIEIIRGAEQQTVKNNQYLFRVGDPGMIRNANSFSWVYFCNFSYSFSKWSMKPSLHAHC